MSASPASTGASDRAELRRVVLAVAVDAHGEVVAVLERVAEAGLHGAADPEVERQPEHARARRSAATLGRAVGRAVVDDDDVEPGSNARSSSITPPIEPSSFSAGTIATRRRSAARRRAGARRPASDTAPPDAEADELEQLPARCT